MSWSLIISLETERKENFNQKSLNSANDLKRKWKLRNNETQNWVFVNTRLKYFLPLLCCIVQAFWGFDSIWNCEETFSEGKLNRNSKQIHWINSLSIWFQNNFPHLSLCWTTNLDFFPLCFLTRLFAKSDGIEATNSITAIQAVLKVEENPTAYKMILEKTLVLISFPFISVTSRLPRKRCVWVQWIPWWFFIQKTLISLLYFDWGGGNCTFKGKRTELGIWALKLACVGFCWWTLIRLWAFLNYNQAWMEAFIRQKRFYCIDFIHPTLCFFIINYQKIEISPIMNAWSLFLTASLFFTWRWIQFDDEVIYALGKKLMNGKLKEF